MNKTSYILICLALIITSFLGGMTLHSAPAPASSQVSTFNDGFSTSKQDDCQQGYQVACDWLKTNTGD